LEQKNIIVIESDQSISKALISLLREIGHTNSYPLEKDANIFQLNTMKPGMAILGPSLTHNSCLHNIQNLKIIDPLMPILTSSNDCVSDGLGFSAYEGIHFLKPDPDKDHLSNAIEMSIKWKETHRSIKKDFPIIIGQSPEIMVVRQKIRKVADKDITILITGETGTGKELVARLIHFKSQRAGKPLVKVDCTSLPDELLESEVFGFQKGAFTDAYRDKPGRLEMAHGGTLFIDEIGDISLSLQIKFMQVFEEKEFSRLGGTTDKVIDARVVVATNAKLWDKVQKGTFRKDLYYRLNVMQIDVPPLRKRKEDVPLLIHYFQNKYCFEYKKEPLVIPPEAYNKMISYPWPGNIRELENIIRRAIAVSDWDFVIKELKYKEHEPDITPETAEDADPYVPLLSKEQLMRLFTDNNFSLKKISKEYLAKIEREIIIKTLRDTHWNRKKAAQLLDVSYKTLINRIDELKLKPYA
jgi:DNA-binding NtrC family response regulator